MSACRSYPTNGDTLNAEQHRNLLGRLGIYKGWLRWPLRLPDGNVLADQRIHRLGVAGAGLVRRHIQQARGVVAWDVRVRGSWSSVGSLPADAAHT